MILFPLFKNKRVWRRSTLKLTLVLGSRKTAQCPTNSSAKRRRTVTTPPPPVGNCTKGWYQYANRKCIQYVNGSMNYNQSVDHCSELGGDLLTIQSQEEQDFVTALIAGKKTPYIGFRRMQYYLQYTINLSW